MSAITQPLRDEHRQLLVRLEALRETADAAGYAPSAAFAAMVEEALDFLSYHLLPHARAEEAFLYPAVARVLGAPRGTATMSRDHVEVERLARELRALRPAHPDDDLDVAKLRALRQVLYGLYAVVQLHFAKEEEVYLPLLDAGLGPEEAQVLFERMEATAASEKRAAPV